MTPEEMAVACETALVMERANLAARGIDLPIDTSSRCSWALGFAAGAKWALDQVRDQLKENNQ